MRIVSIGEIVVWRCFFDAEDVCWMKKDMLIGFGWNS